LTPTVRYQSVNISVTHIKITKETPSLIREMKPYVFAVVSNLQTRKILGFYKKVKYGVKTSYLSNRIQ